MPRNVWIAIPAYTGTIHLATFRSLVTDMLKLVERGDRVHIFDDSGNAMIADCRALMCQNFLESDGTDLVFLDSDVCWEAGKLVELIDANCEFRVGIYPQRRDPLNFCVRWHRENAELRADAETGLLQIDGAPAGFMVMSRNVLERMVAAYPQLDCWNGTVNAKKFTALFDPYWMHDVPVPSGGRGNLKLGEDYSFCQRWLDIGGKIFVDPSIKMGHIGNKTFIGSLGDWLLERPEEKDASANETAGEYERLAVPA